MYQQHEDITLLGIDDRPYIIFEIHGVTYQIPFLLITAVMV